MHSEFTAFVAWPPRDRHRLMLAAHELGHVVAWQHAGFAVAEIKLHPGNVGGEVSLSKSSRTNLRTIEQRRGYLVGLLAGTEAGARWCELAGEFRGDHASGCAWDHRAFMRNQRHFGLTHIPKSEFRREARAIIRAHWRQIFRLAPTLAHRGLIAV
ncbi:hypothetical protein [Amycolatopsis sp. NBC_01286]|uniref:hypothetical protein n=1 Tax=Amycolatopsis sp. NBC_01286 TaxID=2903560 RepID=UPI002E162767|nr:hypothetical protein OG570_48130 [Amycolatopsis sp. NBC_01286]